MPTDPDQNEPKRPGRLRAFLSRLGWPLRIAILVVPLLLFATVAFGLRSAERRGSTDETCVACHLPAQKQLAATVHKSLHCIDCHVVPPNEAVRLSLSRTFGVPAPPPGHSKQSRARCRACHFESPTEKLIVADTIGHKTHVLEGPKLLCGSCHESKNHSVKPRDTTCDKCHDKVQVYEHGMKGVACLNCHNFLASAERGMGEPSTDCQRCHGGTEQETRSHRFIRTIPAPAIRPDQVHGALNACRLCHDPHAPGENARIKGTDCSQCHKRIFEDAKSGAHKNCTGCHQVHGPRPDARTLCTACHQTVMTKGAAAPAKNVVGATVLASRHERCTNCHRTHTFAPDRTSCKDCHKTQVDALATWKSDKHAQCTNCHKAHEATLPAAQCSGCHKGHEGHRHPACTTCHDPHQSRVSTKKCATCHEPIVRVLAVSPAAGHHECGSCHQPHATTAALRTQCAICHGDKVKLVSTAPVAKHQACKSCHIPHEFKKQVEACKGCHQLTQLGQHNKDCQNCHQVHGPPVAKQQSCRTCHEKVAPPGGKHTECTSCHTPHQGPGKGPVCARCHQANATGAAAWPVDKHQSCATCHEHHAPKPVKPCSDCHADKASTIDPAKHKCRGCHEPHRAPPGWWNACATCHRTEAASVSKAGSAIHNACRSCHKPHVKGIPTCATCHAKVGGLHSAKQHSKCVDCHKTHSIALPERAECLKCHTDRQQHFANAARCSGCHLFR